MRSVTSVSLWLAAAVVLAQPAAAQPASDQVGAGDRVRVTATLPLPDAAGKRRVAGRMVATDLAKLTLLPDHISTPVTVPRNMIVKLDKSRGRVPRWQAAIVGAALGAGLGAAVGMILDTAGSSRTGECLVGPVMTIGGLAIGASAGAAIGALKPRREEWVTMRC